MPDATIDDLLAPHTPEVRDLTLRARALIREILPGAHERVYMGWKNVVFGKSASSKDMAVVVAPLKERINIHVAGADLPDPTGLLEGSGKSGRHVKVRTADELANPALRALIEAAVAAHDLPAEARAAKAGPPVDGYRAYASKTVGVSVDRLYDAWVDDGTRARWIGGNPLAIRGTTPGKSLRARWADFPVDARFEAKGDAKSAVSVDQRGMASEDEAADIKAAWKESLDRLKALLEG